MSYRGIPTTVEATKRHGSVMVIVLWTIAIAAIIVSSVQLFGYRQATLGREALARVQARWAARGGLENMLSVMTVQTTTPTQNDGKALIREMYYERRGEMLGASYDIVHQVDGQEYGGPMDEHSKFNINRVEDRGLLMMFDDMTIDVLAALGDWIDADDNPSAMGVERDYYMNLATPFRPRNGPLRSIGEMEMIAGIWPKYFRGEDWNFDHRLDPNENDGAWSFPPDEPDGILDAGWAGRLTVHSATGGATASGQPRLRLKDATPEDVAKRLGLDDDTSRALMLYGMKEGNVLTDLIITPLTMTKKASTPGAGAGAGAGGGGGAAGTGATSDGGGAGGGAGGAGGGAGIGGQNQTTQVPLSDDQLRIIFAETCIENPHDRMPGKMNLNTISSDMLHEIFQLAGMDEAIADEIIYLRGRSQGLTSLVDLKAIPNISAQDLQAITRRFDTVSNVFTITSRGRSQATGQEVEIVAVVDRSSVPVRILEYREQ